MKFSLLPQVAAVALSLGILVVASAGAAGAEQPLYAPGEKIEGKTPAEWSVAFLKWAYGIKKDRNPILDGSGAFAAEGQSGPAWFLAGSFGGVTRRKVTVPAGKPIFMPVVYTVRSALPGANPEDMVAGVRKMSDAARDLKVTVDGKNLGDLSKYRIVSGAFLFTGPDKPADAVHPIFAGKRLLAADGWWVMLKPLPPGEHTVRWKGRMRGDTEEEDRFRIDITYEITVVEPSKP